MQDLGREESGCVWFTEQRFHRWGGGERWECAGGSKEHGESEQGAQGNSGSSGALGHLQLTEAFACGEVLLGGLGVRWG